ncbi:hydrogenase expression/formation protein HypE [Ferrimicrobium sp.]|uniref:hydrogenase expression/formation protein HypE n=1 Tax=Ferrimicrobium sp. TaxID=2926050 RepID=UPI0026377128|nr:hydrogenase expression/formation protein HypE [Ferrimicrobium sp.]
MTTWFADPEILMAHGAGGKASRKLLEGLIAPVLAEHGSPAALGDSFNIAGTDFWVTTDSFVVSPNVFPGGCLGELAVNGTLNDLAVAGAEPLVLTSAIIIEAGTSSQELKVQLEGMAKASQAAEVPIVAGDTKVVEHGKGDRVYITTTGVGRSHPKANLDPGRVQPGDAVICSGTLGDHGITILMARGELDFTSASLASDTANLWPLIKVLLDEFGGAIKWMRDPTRGGLASTLNELAEDAKVEILVEEGRVPIANPVRGACEILGLDPFHIANEGKLVAIISADYVDQVLATMKAHPLGRNAAHIGTVRESTTPMVVCATEFGAHRTLDMLTGDPLPRIC